MRRRQRESGVPRSGQGRYFLSADPPKSIDFVMDLLRTTPAQRALTVLLTGGGAEPAGRRTGRQPGDGIADARVSEISRWERGEGEARQDGCWQRVSTVAGAGWTFLWKSA